MGHAEEHDSTNRRRLTARTARTEATGARSPIFYAEGTTRVFNPMNEPQLIGLAAAILAGILFIFIFPNDL